MSRLRRDVVRLQSELERSKNRIDDLELRMTRLSRKPDPKPGPSPSVRLPKSLPRVRVGPGGTETVAEAEGPPVLIRVRGKQQGVLAVDDTEPAAVAGANPDALYHGGLDALREQRNPELALERFNRFRRAYPRHALVDNALYWSGEARMMLLEHRRALKLFQRVLDEHPRSNKVPWAELRFAESQLALGQLDAGRRRLRRVRTTYPGTEPARLASARLQVMTTNEDPRP